MSRLFGPIFQTAYVVEDIDAALDHWTNRLGVGPFFMFPTPLPFKWMKRDEMPTTEYNILSHAALSYSGDTMIELIRPGSDPSPYRDFLDAGRSGLHHLGTFATDYDAQMKAAREAGIRVAVEGELPISRFSYLATDVLFPGTMIELIEPSDEMLRIFADIKAAAASWDGRDPVRTL